MNLLWRKASSELSRTALIVYLLLQEEGAAALSPTAVEKMGFMTKSAASKAIRELKEKGYLTENNTLIYKDSDNIEYRRIDLNSKEYSVYQLLFPDGKTYYGITNQSVEERWRNGLGYQYHPELNAAIDKCGWNNVVKVVLARGLNRMEAAGLETSLIKSAPEGANYNRRISSLKVKET